MYILYVLNTIQSFTIIERLELFLNVHHNSAFIYGKPDVSNVKIEIKHVCAKMFNYPMS